MKKFIKPLILIVALTAAEIISIAVPDSYKHQSAEHSYFAWIIAIITVVYLIGATVMSMKSKKR